MIAKIMIVKIMITITVMLFLVELTGYLWHRFVNHLGYLGDTIRITHHCHHEIVYPHDDMDSNEYKTSHDTWPWLVPLVLFGYVPLIILYKMNKLSRCLVIISLLQISLHIIIIGYIHNSYHINDHWLNKYDWYTNNKKLHHIHHLDNKNYGIT